MMTVCVLPAAEEWIIERQRAPAASGHLLLPRELFGWLLHFRKLTQ
jgi:hypothetical protein